MLICKGSLTSSLYIDSCWVYVILKWLIFFWYVVHVCRGSFTSPFIHCILCFMWLGFSHLFSYKCMYAGGVNFMSLLFMNVYSIYTFIVLIYAKREKNIVYSLYCLYPFVDELTKRGRDILEFDICMFVHICFCFYMHMCLNLLSFTIGTKSIFCWYWYQEHLLLFCWYQEFLLVLRATLFLRTCLL